jgi:hypothetical protein
MKTLSKIMFFCILGIFILSGCKKESTINVPISFTNKQGDIFIQIDTLSKSFFAYSQAKVTKGQIKGIFNDTIRSSFRFALATTPYWDTVYHPSDTIILANYNSHTLAVSANVNLTNYTSPYHFILLGLATKEMTTGPAGRPSIMMTFESSEN